jgi:hypothetical protein
MHGPIGHGFGLLAGVFGAIVWAIGTFVLLAVIVALVILLARFLWFGTKASQRYLELNGSPTPRMRAAAPAAAAAAPSSPAPTTNASKPPTGEVSKPRTAKPPVL